MNFKITLHDNGEESITVDEETSLGDFIDYLKDMFPDGRWTKFKIKINTDWYQDQLRREELEREYPGLDIKDMSRHL